MYAIIKTGGKQYKVSQGSILRVERLNAAEGDTIAFEEVLMIVDGENITVGAPFIEGTSVAADVKAHGRAKKVEVIKFKRRKHHRKQMGHRQDFTEVEIKTIGGKASAKKVTATVAKDAPADVLFLSAPNGEADDLKEISGVGPVLEKKLNALGIYHFSQVAAFTAEDIAKVDEVLNFKGRIERDDWLAQAKQLAEESK